MRITTVNHIVQLKGLNMACNYSTRKEHFRYKQQILQRCNYSKRNKF